MDIFSVKKCGLEKWTRDKHLCAHPRMGLRSLHAPHRPGRASHTCRNPLHPPHRPGQARHPTHAITRLQGGGDVENAGPGSGEALPQRNEWRATDRHLKPSSSHSTSAQQCAQHSDRQTDSCALSTFRSPPSAWSPAWSVRLC